jgi:hypothetical protein
MCAAWCGLSAPALNELNDFRQPMRIILRRPGCILALFAVISVYGCSTEIPFNSPSTFPMRQQDDLEFDFTELEVYAAMRLVVPEAEARRQAAAFAEAYRPGTDWAIDDDGLLLLLSLGSESGAARVQRLRNALRQGRYDQWLSDERRRDPSISAAELAGRWSELILAEERDWSLRLAERRRELQ